jgi:hypothetical protein
MNNSFHTSSPARRPPAADPGFQHHHRHDLPFRSAAGWGVVVGVANAGAPLAFWWLDASSVHALAIALIAAIYIGFAVADGRRHVIVAECAVAALFVILAAAAITLSPWLLVAGYFAHGCKDLWQHRSHFVAGTRWWPPFCLAVDWTVAGIIAGAIAAGIGFH